MPTPPPTADPLKRLPQVAAFKPGFWNGKSYGLGTLAALARNFGLLSTGDRPYYRPYVSLNHDDGLAFGRVSAAEVKDGTLFLDADDVPAEVARLSDRGQLQAPSIEFWEPGQFTMPDGTPNREPVLKCLTLLGNKPPGVKGLPPLPPATFAHRGKATKFAGTCHPRGKLFMDRQAKIEMLKAAGFDASGLTDAVPDPVLDAIVAFVQGAAAAASPPPAATPPAAMSDDKDKDDKDKMDAMKFAAKKFSDQFAGILANQQATLAVIKAQSDALAREHAAQLAAVKTAKIKAFCDELQAAGRLAPAARADMEFLLGKCDDVKVAKFADGKTDGTELAERMARLRAALPVVRTFADQMADPGHGLTTAERDRMLRADPIGRAALERLNKK